MSHPAKPIPRSEVLTENTWALEDLYATEADFLADLETLKGQIPQLESYKDRLGTDAKTLLSYLRFCDDVSLRTDNLANYACRLADQDTKNAHSQELRGKLFSLLVELDSASSFDTPEILSIPDEVLERFFQDEPDLELYRTHLSQIRRRKAHILSKEEEKILALAGEVSQSPDDIFSMLNDADLTFPDAVDAKGEKHPITHGTFIPTMQSTDRVLRKSAFESLYHTYDHIKNTSAAVLSAQVKQLQFLAKARHYDSSLEAALDVTNVPVSVYRNLIDAVRQNLPKMHKYVSLRKKLLGVDELHFYDIYAPMAGETETYIPYETAKQNTYDALAVLGDDYRRILKEGFDNRWVDVYENIGKRSGAYSAGAKVHPYVLLNYAGMLDDEFTVAHEMGHALHSYLSNKHQPQVYSDYVIFVAEVASTCNEALLMEYLLPRTTDRIQRGQLINYFLEQFKGTIFRQTMFAEFEETIGKLHAEGQALTAETLCSVYRKLNEDYFGPDMVVDDEIALEWARIPHFFMNYYVYQYATGYAAAIALSRRILKEGEPAVRDYLRFLSGGCSKDPVSLLKDAGVDMMKPDAINDALALFGELVEEMDALMSEKD
jgi:oligoendopeptidase F